MTSDSSGPVDSPAWKTFSRTEFHVRFLLSQHLSVLLLRMVTSTNSTVFFQDDRLSTSTGWVELVGILTRKCIKFHLSDAALAVAEQLRGDVGNEIQAVLKTFTPVDRSRKPQTHTPHVGIVSSGPPLPQPMPMPAQPPQPPLPSPMPPPQPAIPTPPTSSSPLSGRVKKNKP